MLHKQQNTREFRQTMCQWADDHATDRIYGEERWARLGKKAESLSNSWDLSDEWEELSPEDIVTISEYH